MRLDIWQEVLQECLAQFRWVLVFLAEVWWYWQEDTKALIMGFRF